MQGRKQGAIIRDLELKLVNEMDLGMVVYKIAIICLTSGSDQENNNQEINSKEH
jgi:hypothetical protein